MSDIPSLDAFGDFIQGRDNNDSFNSDRERAIGILFSPNPEERNTLLKHSQSASDWQRIRSAFANSIKTFVSTGGPGIPPSAGELTHVVRLGGRSHNYDFEGKFKVMSGSFQATNTIFGDPTPGVVKEIQSLTVDTSDSDNSDESDFDSDDSSSPLDTDPPSTDRTPINFNRYTKIIGKSQSGKTIKRYNSNQPKCVKDCALNKQCVGVITNKSGTRCKTITDFSNPHRSLNIAYLKK